METNKNKVSEFITNVIFGLSIISLFLAFNFSDKMNGWYQQFLPAGITNNINSLVFTDSLTGYIATATDNNALSYILKTTNGGDNWFVLINDTGGNNYSDLHFFNKDTAYIQRYNQIYKTTNAGTNWFLQCTLPWVSGFFALNLDTIFCLDSQPVIGGFWRTTNGGTSWVKLVNFGSMNPEGVYFYNKNIGYINRGGGTWKTIDGGFNWFQIPGNYGDLYFIDSLIGYKTTGYISKTTDGGLNWVNQQQPNIYYSGFNKISLNSKDTIWGVGGAIIKNNKYYGIVYKTTNGGTNWGYQIPLDTNTITQFLNISGFTTFKIWPYFSTNTGVHTKVGGSDTTIFTSVNNEITDLPKDFILEQNYPNPFNPVTSIKYQVLRNSNVKLIIFNITGQEITTLVNERKSTGTYEVKFDGSDLSSGIYFYILFADGRRIVTKRMVLVR